MKLGLSLLILFVLWSSPARAQSTSVASVHETTAEDTRSPAERARELGRQGLDAYGAGDFTRALEHFQRAEELMHSPVFQLYAARCLLSLGRTDEGRALYERILEEAPPEGDPEPWQRARSEAQKELEALGAEPPQEVESGLPADFDADGHVSRSVSGEARMPSWREEPPPRKNLWQRMAPNQRGAAVAVGAGTIGLVFSVVTGVLAVVESAAIKENCIGTSCRPEDLPRAQNAEQLANLATVGALVAVAGGTTGAVLWLLPSERSDAALAVTIGGRGMVVSGTF